MNDLLEFISLRRYFEGEQGRYVLESGSLATGGILVLKGPSGTGKSTFLKTLARLLQAQGGQVYLQGQDWLNYSPSQWRVMVQYVPQKPVVFGGSLEDNLRRPFGLKSYLGKTHFDRQQALAWLDKLSLPDRRLTQAAATLSGGEAARMALIRAMLTNPRVLLLDEPTAYLDGGSRSRVIELISEWVKTGEGRGIIMVSHHDDDLEDLPEVSVLNMTAKGGV
jgi:putative ABC transport system ATP-binding protein